jgi:alanyl-tRNA synthetase
MADLYYQDAYLTEFSATVTDIEERDEKPWAILDRTAFYPEGGGQPGDRGRIGEARVLDTQKEGDRVLHLLDRSLLPGEYLCEVDWAHRFDYMQQHTGQHIISACLYRNHDISTVAVHQGEEHTSVETDASSITEEILSAVESESNELIRRDLPIVIDSKSEEELSPGELRRQPKKKGLIRIVSIKDVDSVACGGVHTGRTAEVGLIKLLGTETIRGRIRTLWKIGDRAYDDYQMKHRTVTEIGTLLSSPPEEVLDRTRRLEEKLRETEYRRRELELILTRRLAEELGGATGDRKVIQGIVEEPHIDFTELMKSLSEEPGRAAVIVYLGDDTPQWGVSDTREATIDQKELRENVLAPLDAKGGGRPPIWRGMLPRREDAERFLATAQELFGRE